MRGGGQMREQRCDIRMRYVLQTRTLLAPSSDRRQRKTMQRPEQPAFARSRDENSKGMKGLLFLGTRPPALRLECSGHGVSSARCPPKYITPEA